MTLNEEQRAVLSLAIDIYGRENQIDKAIEEMAELTKALLKHRHMDYNSEEAGAIDRKLQADVEEEIADVIIMMEQVSMMYDLFEIKDYINAKVDRLAQRLHEEV